MYEGIEKFLQRHDNDPMPIRYTYSKIKKITNGFKDKLGEGSFGLVYKGKLYSGRFAAVKILASQKSMDKILSMKLPQLEEFTMPMKGSVPLSNEKMYEISLRVARGIQYLHQGCDMKILHFDIKSHNILLNDKFVLKVSNFRLAKLYPTNNNIVPLIAAWRDKGIYGS
ncbi:hypothetical protein POTOM_054466 [Populus tomentosa]|uniref:Protein kinase domain-containing protein n=1 Tax=Populus tomentosa TaxID=118781 RepID=A0A8X7XV76_POPTO|nr:hypothetical protein POTOM_054466 [Populus tomentosa]